MKNLQEFKQLIERYRSITMEEIEENSVGSNGAKLSMRAIASRLTGFGRTDHCILCTVIYEDCSNCVWYALEKHSMRCLAHSTYHAISLACTKESLLEAFRDRADYMQFKLEQYERNIKEASESNK